MPGENRNFTFKLPVVVADIDTMSICFYQNDDKLIEYDETMTDNIYGVGDDENLLVCALPREDTLKFENKIRAQVQIEWEIDGFHSVAKAQRISVGDYLNKEYIEGE